MCESVLGCFAFLCFCQINTLAYFIFFICTLRIAWKSFTLQLQTHSQCMLYGSGLRFCAVLEVQHFVDLNSFYSYFRFMQTKLITYRTARTSSCYRQHYKEELVDVVKGKYEWIRKKRIQSTKYVQNEKSLEICTLTIRWWAHLFAFGRFFSLFSSVSYIYSVVVIYLAKWNFFKMNLP